MKKPLSIDANLENYYQYDFHVGSYRGPKAWTDSKRGEVWPEIEAFIASNAESNTETDQPAPANLQSYFDESRAFVEDTTGYDLSGIKFAVSTNKGNLPTALHDPTDSAVRMSQARLKDFENLPPNVVQQMLTALYVHELTHATGENVSRLVGVQYESGDTGMHLMMGMQPVDMRSVVLEVSATMGSYDDMRVGHFFEEGLAEEMAARWRETSNDHIRNDGDKECSLWGVGFPKLPFRYVDVEGGYSRFPADYTVAHSAICAAGLRALSQYTKVDLFDLMLEARDPAKEAIARRAIARTINEVQPGLYTKLRDTIYTVPAFSRSYALILDAINHSA